MPLFRRPLTTYLRCLYHSSLLPAVDPASCCYSYLANQSTLLLNYSTPPTPLVNSMVTANSKAQTLCLQGDPTLSPALNPNINFLQHRFPSIRILQAPFPGPARFSPRFQTSPLPQPLLVLLLLQPSNTEPPNPILLANFRADYISMIGDKCDGAIVQSTDWMAYKGSNSINPGDLLFQRGPPLLSDSNRFATSFDFTQKKSVFFNKAFSVTLATVQQTGGLLTAYYNVVSAAQDFETKCVLR